MLIRKKTFLAYINFQGTFGCNKPIYFSHCLMTFVTFDKTDI